jgi:hypothetical protein
MPPAVCDKLDELRRHQKTLSFDDLHEAFCMAGFERRDPWQYPQNAIYVHPKLGTRQWTVYYGDDQLSPGEVASAIEAIEEAVADECEP